MITFHPKTPSKCPPEDALPSNGVYFRIVINNPPTMRDFVIWIEEPNNRDRLQEKIRQSDCQAFAISVFTTEESTLYKIKKFPRGWKQKSILYGSGFLGVAEIKLDPNSGVIKQTGKDPKHYDLWPYVDSRLECNIVSVKGV